MEAAVFEKALTSKEKHKAGALRWYYANKEKARATQKQYYKNHTTDMRERYKAWHDNNKDKCAAYAKEYQSAHKKEIAEYFKQYHGEHKEKLLAKHKAYYVAHRKEMRLAAKVFSVSHPEKIKEYYLNGKEKRKPLAKIYRDSNKEKIKATRDKYSATHRTEINLRAKKYKQAHPDKATRNYLERRARKLNATVEKFFVSEIYERDGWICGLCGKKVNNRLKYPNPMSASLDHIVPLSLGGAHSKTNVHLAHLHCNLKAHTGGIKQTLLF